MSEALPLSSDRSCDTVIIGAVIVGISTAYELATQGQKVIVIDREKISGSITARTTRTAFSPSGLKRSSAFFGISAPSRGMLGTPNKKRGSLEGYVFTNTIFGNRIAAFSKDGEVS